MVYYCVLLERVLLEGIERDNFLMLTSVFKLFFFVYTVIVLNHFVFNVKYKMIIKSLFSFKHFRPQGLAHYFISSNLLPDVTAQIYHILCRLCILDVVKCNRLDEILMKALWPKCWNES